MLWQPSSFSCELQNPPFTSTLDKANTFQTDTHGWLEGHLKERNYGADWGDFKSFTEHMKHKAGNLGVDLLLIDTGKLSLFYLYNGPMLNCYAR